MDNQIQEKLIQWIQTTTAQIQDFATTQIPPFIHEYLQWKFWESAIDIIGYTILLIIISGLYIHFMFPIWKKCIDYCKNINYSNNNELWTLIPVVITVIIITLFTTSFPIHQIKDCIQISIAPKVYILEQGIKLIKN